ncbi:VOC family protein [Streptomyces sp. RB6PN25]|uniref:VOC family protein n=1 Tax=Streptomyces humicola TaxID=2953240 RepID=A0ABT1Q5P7_9ACTN|nr:VOC family protein [Streptomyces humicola]MCQ4084670.1 VOC family protein [Streptomyces humicola]
MKASAIHHVSVCVEKLDDAVDFYTRRLGLRLRDDRPDTLGRGAWLDAGPQQLHLIEAAPPPGRGQHFALAVADLDAATTELRAAGVQVSEAIRIGSARQAFVTDPSGNAIELHEPSHDA